MYDVNVHLAEIVGIDFASIMSHIHIHRPLCGMTQVEEMLISAVMPIMSIYRQPQDQYGYRGHVINLPQDVVHSQVACHDYPLNWM